MSKPTDEIVPGYITIQEAATHMKLCVSTVRTLINLNLLKEYRPSERTIRLKLSEVEEYVKKTAKR